MERDAFYLRVARALSACQLVEQELKLYITEAFDLVRKKLEGELPFRFSGEQYENSSLERLIDTFARLSNNDKLVADLRKFKDERNHLSHRAIALCINPDGEFDEGTAHNLEPRLAAIEPEAERIRGEIHEAGSRVMANLYFDKIPPDAG
jgi:hypothetical protein